MTAFLTLSSNNSGSTTSLLSNSESGSVGLLSNPNEAETIGSLSMLTNSGTYVDAFAGKDMLGTPDFSNMDQSIAYASQTETVGSLACADFGSLSAGFSGADAGASASAGASCGSCGGGSFSSVC